MDTSRCLLTRNTDNAYTEIYETYESYRNTVVHQFSALSLSLSHEFIHSTTHKPIYSLNDMINILQKNVQRYIHTSTSIEKNILPDDKEFIVKIYTHFRDE